MTVLRCSVFPLERITTGSDRQPLMAAWVAGAMREKRASRPADRTATPSRVPSNVRPRWRAVNAEMEAMAVCFLNHPLYQPGIGRAVRVAPAAGALLHSHHLCHPFC